MAALDTGIFGWLASAYATAPWLLSVARALAVYSAWAMAVLVVWSLYRRPLERRYVGLVLLAGAVATLVAHYIASKTGVPRPFVAGFSPAYIRHSPTGSLPSSHATVAMLVSTLYLYRRPLRSVGVAMLALALGTGLGRIAVGVHYPSDIAAGYALGLLLAAVFVYVRARVQRAQLLSADVPGVLQAPKHTPP